MTASLNAKDLKRLILATQRFVDKSSRRPLHQYIRLVFSKEFSKVTAIAVDGNKMSVESAVCSEIDEDFNAYLKPYTPKYTSGNSIATVQVIDDTCFVKIDDCVIGYTQPKGDPFDYQKALTDATNKELRYRIGVNGDLLIDALRAAKASSGDSYKHPVILEFYGNRDPFILRTNSEDLKLICPVRIQEN